MSSTSIANTGLIGPNDTFIRAPNYVNNTAMGVSSAASLTIPDGGKYVRLTGDVDFYVKWGATSVSTAAATNGSASERVNVATGGVLRDIGSTLGTTAISIISTAASIVTQSWWSV